MELLRSVFVTLAMACAMAAGGCSEMKANREPLRVDIEGVSYSIPRDHLVQSVLPGEGELYVVARAPQAAFQVVHDATHRRRRNYQGVGAPLVPRINDISARAFEIFDFPSGATVCRVGPPHWNCGLRLVDGGVVWSVQFDRDQVPESESLRAAASSLLAGYRQASRAAARMDAVRYAAARRAGAERSLSVVS